MLGKSGLLKAGTILLLAGGILHTVAAFLLTLAGVLLLIAPSVFLDEGDEFPTTVLGSVYLVVAIVLVVGAVFGFRAWRSAQAGQPRRAWAQGLASSLLPPLQVVTLIGAILCKVSPEAEAPVRAQAP